MEPALEIAAAIQTFLDDIQQLEYEYGSEAVGGALEILLPGFDLDATRTSGDEIIFDDEIEPLYEGRVLKAGSKLGEKVANWWKKLKNKMKPGLEPLPRGAEVGKGVAAGTGIGALGLGAAGLGTAGLSAAASAALEKKVDIVDISTDDALNVNSDDLEDLLSQTNKALENMTRALEQVRGVFSSRLDDLDTSVDDMIAVSTGETPTDVAVRQQGGAAARRPPRKKTAKKEKTSIESPSPSNIGSDEKSSKK
jgi:hypothetical protein